MSLDKPLILVVDDEAHILHVVSLKLQHAGFRVITASDGEEALGLALKHEPMLVITDFQMPLMTGLELCRRLKLHKQTCETPCIMITARGHNLLDEDYRETNIALVMSKPFSPREVLAQVDALLNSANY